MSAQAMFSLLTFAPGVPACNVCEFPINEPADGIKKSQIEEYLDFYQGAGLAGKIHIRQLFTVCEQ